MIDQEMAVGEYVMYQRASKDEERLFLKIAIEVVNTVKEPSELDLNPEIQRTSHARRKANIISFQTNDVSTCSDELSPKGLQRNGSASKMQ